MARVILIQPLPFARLDSLENLQRALALLARCQGQKADVICFPEYFPFFGEKELAQAALDLQAYIVAGLVEEVEGKLYNTATLFDRRGVLVGRQRKVTLGDLERRAFNVSPGKNWQIFETDFGRLGIPVCIDFWGQPEAVRQLAAQKVDLIINPAIFPILRDHWSVGALARAFDYYLPVVGINCSTFTAEISGRHYPHQGGGSFAIQPSVPADERDLRRIVRGWNSLQDWIILQGGEAEEIFSVTLDLEGVRKWRPVIQERFGI